VFVTGSVIPGRLAASLTLKQEPIIRDIIIDEVYKFTNLIDREY